MRRRTLRRVAVAAAAAVTLASAHLASAEPRRVGTKTCPLTKSGLSYSSVEYEESEDDSGKRELVVICRYGSKVEERSSSMSCGKAPMWLSSAVISGGVLVTVWCDK